MAEQRYGTITSGWVFEAAMDKMDSRDDDGSYDTDDNEEYKVRAVTILNDVCQELYKYSDTCDIEAGKRPVCPLITEISTSAVLGTDDYINKTLLPDKLAAELLADENPSLANYYQQEYERKLAKMLAEGIPAESATEITDVYSYGGASDFGGYGDSWYYNRGPIW